MKKTPKRGLVIEGGGSRGAHTAGMLISLTRQANLPSFDVVCATSAGASSGAFFVAHQCDRLKTVWEESFRDKQFMDLKRTFTRRSIMDFDYLVDEVFRKKVPLDYQAIEKSPCDFFICATNCETGGPHYFRNRRDPLDRALKASGAIPLAYKTPIVIEGTRYVDGGIVDSIPVKKAIAEGCDEVWVFLTQTEDYRKEPTPYFPWRFTSFRHYSKLIEAIKNRHIHYNETLDFLHSPPDSVRIHIFRPLSPLTLNRFSNNLTKIRKTMDQGESDAIVCLTKVSHL